MQCPSCNSDNCQRLEVTYDGGTQNVNTQSNTAGVGIAGGGLGVGAANTSTTGVIRSRLAEKAAPPQKGRYIYAIISIFILWFLWSVSQTFIWQTVFFLLIVACFYWIYTVFNFNSKTFPNLYAFWQKQWICLKCGEIYHID